MAIWTGWQKQLLTQAGLSEAEITQEFLFDWHQHSASDCKNNPIDISRSMSGATNCHKLTSTRTAKNYTSRAQGALAFAREINSGSFPHLRAQLTFADPFEAPSVSRVVSDIKKWGSPAFANYFQAHAHSGTGADDGGGPGTGEPHVHKGWRDLRRSFNSRAPHKLHHARKLVRQAMKASSHGGKVKH